MPKASTPKATAPVAAPVAKPGPAIATVADKFGDIDGVILAAVSKAQEAKALSAAYRLMGGKSVSTAEAAVGNVAKFHDKALARFIGDAKFRASALDAASKASGYSLEDLAGMVRGIVNRGEVIHPKALNGSAAITGSAARDLRKAPECFRFAALARIDALPFMPGRGLATFITAL